MARNLKQEIINEATQLFMEQGYFATSTHQIAKKLSITQPALYHYFPNKEALYIHVFHGISEENRLGLNTLLNNSRNTYDTIVKMSEYLEETHHINIVLFKNDLKHHLPEDSLDTLNTIFQESYVKPFASVFNSLKPKIKEDLLIEDLANHYLLTLSAYISSSHCTNLKIKDFVSIFFNGILER